MIDTTTHKERAPQSPRGFFVPSPAEGGHIARPQGAQWGHIAPKIGARSAQNRRAAGAHTDPLRGAQSDRPRPAGLTARAGAAGRTERRGGRAAVDIARFIVALCAPPCAFISTKTAAGHRGCIGGIYRGYFTPLLPLFLSSRAAIVAALPPPKWGKNGG